MPRARRVHFTTVGHILRELGRQYRRADAGDLDWVEAGHAARILREMRVAIEGSELERRIEALEQTLVARGHERPRPNGHARQDARQ